MIQKRKRIKELIRVEKKRKRKREEKRKENVVTKEYKKYLHYLTY